MKKKEFRDCFCALCRSPRKLRYSRHLGPSHFAQIVVLTIVLTAVSFPWLGAKGLVSLPLVWILFESLHKMLYRKDSKCTVCGFDPLWYKKDIKIARQKVEEFLKQNPDSPIFRRIKVEDILNSRPN